MNASPGEVMAARRAARQAASAYRLPFRARTWRGATGNWAGTGVGSSIDFQDHRPYQPGDDPRYIDWQAYARTGSYVMKLYREEVSPRVDLVLDASASMSFEAAKRRRTLEAFFFVAESALAGGAKLRAWLATADGPRLLPPEVLREGGEPAAIATPSGGRIGLDGLAAIAYRPGSLRVVVSDCLFPGAPDGIARALAARKGRGILLAPATASESDPPWSGNLDLVDCEKGERRLEQIDRERLERYREAYRRHFELWATTCRRQGVAFARLPAEEDLAAALSLRAARVGAVEPWD